jgi:hypothetical protein
MTYFTVALISALFFLLPSTRKYSVLIIGVLVYFYPLLTIGILLVTGAAFYYLHRSNII